MLLIVLRRLLYVLPVALGVSLVCFMLVHLAPGDPLTAVMPIDATAEQQAEMRAAYGFDRPLPVQYLAWLGQVVRGDLGESIYFKTAAGPLILSKLKTTLLLGLMALLFALLVSVPLWSLPVFYVASRDLNFKAYPDELVRFWEMTWK